MIVAIHQPNFFPWLGYFDKIRRSDVFIFLDDVQFPKTGGVWSNRVKLLINGDARWLTAPVDRGFHGTRNINEMVFSDGEDWRSKSLKTIFGAYKRAPFFDEAYSIIEPLVAHPETNVAEYNIYAIKSLANILGYSAKSLIRSSDLSTECLSTKRLVDLTTLVGGAAYLSGGGATGYQKDEEFENSGINLIYQHFVHPVYPQFSGNEFVGGLSIVDALMNLGFEGVQKLLQSHAK